VCYPSAVRTLSLVAVSVMLSGASGCRPQGTVDPTILEAEREGAWSIYEALELRVASGSVSDADRLAALEKLRVAEDDHTAAYAYARAAVAGRVAELRGLKALKILEEMRTWSLESIARDPGFEDMAAQRMLGTLYVLAGDHLDAGDSEDGLELLEAVVDSFPDRADNQLRLAEAYIALGDPDPGIEPLCLAALGRAALSGEEQILLASLLEELGGQDSLCIAL